ncbi:uncharacterized protein LOC112050192 [Bicyclus anynana]|uniref:Uncharacterized protein LOC112050192 n=1 Tax=Bicyclus anynana TaxID=110368 RepID=A0A6J1NGQ1_BICAN|nr:uncharacterized protein LOC112050192 [Bicyclus anynana]
MFKFLFVILASALLVEGSPVFPAEIAEAAKGDNWLQFNKLYSLSLPSLNNGWEQLTGSVQSLKPSDGTHVYGHSVAAFKQWQNVDGKVTQNSKGIELENNDGVLTSRVFKP